MIDTTDPQSQQEYHFEVAIPFESESYRNPPYLPDWLNPWYYRTRRRMRNVSENTVHEQWDDWNLNGNDAAPGGFTPSVVRGRKAGDSTHILEWVCMIAIAAPDRNDARASLENVLSSEFDEYTIKPFDGTRFLRQVGPP
jgi:hypothetical protein